MADIIDSIVSKAALIHDLAVQAKHVDLQQKIAELQRSLANLLMEHNALRSENIGLQEQIKNLELRASGELVFKDAAYFLKDSDELYCFVCLDNDHVLSRLTQARNSPTTYRCRRCKDSFYLPH